MAVGYNAFHEMVRFAIPALFVPMRRETDDQGARARYAASVGVALAVDGPQDERIEDRLGELLDADRRGAMRERLEELRPDNGAARGRPCGSRHSLNRREKDRPRIAWGIHLSAMEPSDDPPYVPARFRAWVFVRTIPKTITRLMNQTLTLPRPTTIILAFGADEAASGTR